MLPRWAASAGIDDTAHLQQQQRITAGFDELHFFFPLRN
jgi:hypothetical protein